MGAVLFLPSDVARIVGVTGPYVWQKIGDGTAKPTARVGFHRVAFTVDEVIAFARAIGRGVAAEYALAGVKESANG